MAKETKDAKKAAKGAAKLKGDAHLVLLLDESGSMGHNVEAVVEGVNEFLSSSRKNKDADVRVWLGMFDKHPDQPKLRVKVDGKKVKKVDDLTAADYCPRGTTPLNDAIIETIEKIDKKLQENERVFMVIITDGMENASENSQETVKKLISKREASDQWTFLYLGANQDAEAVARGLGLNKKGTALAFRSTPQGTRSSLAYATQDSSSFLSSSSKHEHEKLRSATYDETGGVILPDEEEIKKLSKKS